MQSRLDPSTERQKIDNIIGYLGLEEQYLRIIQQTPFFPSNSSKPQSKIKGYTDKKVYSGSWDMSGCKNSSKHFYLNTQCIFWLNWRETSQLSSISFLSYHTTTYTTGFCLEIFPLCFLSFALIFIYKREKEQNHNILNYFILSSLFSQK